MVLQKIITALPSIIIIQKIMRLREALRKLHLSLPSMITTIKPSLTWPSIFNDNDLCCCDHHDHDGYSGQASVNDHHCCRCKDKDNNYVPPTDVQKGFFAVYVGHGDDDEEEESMNIKRYVIPLTYLRHPVFETLLRRAEERFGFSHDYKGGMRLPCQTVLFDHLLWLLNRDDPSIQSLEVDELLNFYA